ncbi:MAG: endo-1,4-beta-xylanase [Litorimonas sp.]
MEFTARDRLRLLAGVAGLTMSGCGGGSSVSVTPKSGVTPPLVAGPTTLVYVPPIGIFRDTYRNKFVVGAAVEPSQLSDGLTDSDILKDQFNAITAENVMKPQALAPTENTYTFEAADSLLAFADANNMALRGHTLLWHRATPDYFFQGTRAEIRARLEKYVTDVVTHFKGRVFAWDVVNEVISDDDGPTAPYRNSNWYQAAGGPEYIDWVFKAARKADPDARLFINDYNTELVGKRGRLLQVVKDLQDRGIPIDGVGHQMHIQAATPTADVLAAIDDVDNQFMGLLNHITELDISIYSDPRSCFESQTNCAADYGNNVPQAVIDDQAQKYRDLYAGFASRPSVTSVTTWGITDAQSWLNSFPIDRRNMPLLYDRDGSAKSAFRAIVDPGFVI